VRPHKHYDTDFLLSAKFGDVNLLLHADYEDVTKNVPLTIIFFGKLHL
jgi:hypothetical protein